MGSLPLGLVAFGIDPGSAQSTYFASPYERPPGLATGTVLSETYNMRQVVFGRQTHEVEACAPVILLPYPRPQFVRMGR